MQISRNQRWKATSKLHKKLHYICGIQPYQNGRCISLEQTSRKRGLSFILHFFSTSEGLTKIGKILMEPKIYLFICLCFGVSSRSRVFTKLMKVPAVILKRLNIV